MENNVNFTDLMGKMARFDTIPAFTGSYGPVCIYKMYGRYFMRSRSSLTGERVKTDPAFRKTMQYAGLLARASRIGSVVYALVPGHRRQHALYRKLTGEAMTWLKYQWEEQDIIGYLTRHYAGVEPPPPDGPVTVLRARYRPPRPGLRPTLPVPALSTPEKRVPRRLQEWRERDKVFRRITNIFSDKCATHFTPSYTWASRALPKQHHPGPER